MWPCLHDSCITLKLLYRFVLQSREEARKGLNSRIKQAEDKIKSIEVRHRYHDWMKTWYTVFFNYKLS